MKVTLREMLVGILLMAVGSERGYADEADLKAEFGQFVVAVRGVDGDDVFVACADRTITDGRIDRFVVFSPEDGRVWVRGSEMDPASSDRLVGLASWNNVAVEQGRLIAAWIGDGFVCSTDVICLKERKRLFRVTGRWPMAIHDVDEDGVGDLLVVTNREHEGSSINSLRFVSGESGKTLDEWDLIGEVKEQPALLDVQGLASLQCLVTVQVGDKLRLVRRGRDVEKVELEIPAAKSPASKWLLPFSSVGGLHSEASLHFTSVVHNSADELNVVSMHRAGDKSPSIRLRGNEAGLEDRWGFTNYFGSRVACYRVAHGDTRGQVLVGAHAAKGLSGVVLSFDATDGKMLQVIEGPESKKSTHFGSYLCLVSGLRKGGADWLLVGAAFEFDGTPGAIHAYEHDDESGWVYRSTFDADGLK